MNAASRARRRAARILVPTDFSAASRRALDAAVDLARPLGASVTLLFVEGPFTYGFHGDLLPAAAAKEFFATRRRAAHEALRRLGRRVARRGVGCRLVLARGMPAEAIVAEAARLGVVMIVMPRRTGPSAVLSGGVTGKVVRLAPCPVLTIPAGASAAGARRRAA